MKTRVVLKITVLLIATLGLQFCTEDSARERDEVSILPLKASPAEIAIESADNYDDNQYGLITGATLERWLDNWEANKPGHITGKLVILQNRSTGIDGYQNINPDNTNVFVYVENTFEADATQSNRHTGVVAAATIVASGEKYDQLLNKYNIDPTKDLIVFAGGRGDGPTDIWATGRNWYAARYWGIDYRHLAVLNGAVKYEIKKSYLSNSPSPALPPEQYGRFSVKSLRRDHTALQVTTGELIDLIKNHSNEIWLSDARSAREYAGVANATAGRPQDGVSNPVSGFDGHFKGAVHTPWQAYFDTNRRADSTEYAANESFDVNGGFRIGRSYRYKSKAALKAYFETTKGYPSDKSKTFIVYCRTNTRSQTNGFIGTAILGYPTRYYDGSWSEWSSLSAHNPDASRNSLFEGDPAYKFATDKNELNSKLTIHKVNLSAQESTLGQIGATIAVGATTLTFTSNVTVANNTYLRIGSEWLRVTSDVTSATDVPVARGQWGSVVQEHIKPPTSNISVVRYAENVTNVDIASNAQGGELTDAAISSITDGVTYSTGNLSIWPVNRSGTNSDQIIKEDREYKRVKK